MYIQNGTVQQRRRLGELVSHGATDRFTEETREFFLHKNKNHWLGGALGLALRAFLWSRCNLLNSVCDYLERLSEEEKVAHAASELNLPHDLCKEVHDLHQAGHPAEDIATVLLSSQQTQAA